MARPFPFAAIVGQDEMKQALLIAAVDPTIGGVLVLGDRGTGKSTAVRALADLLPEEPSVPGCPYGCAPDDDGCDCDACRAWRSGDSGRVRRRRVPVVDLPLGVTEDRVVGALDLERALVDGQKVFEPGLLAQAHRGFLYIDEVNLLEDHIVDLLLDVAATGENVVEREGLSVRHPSRFVLVGSGNPEEGELRPQLMDRFGLAVEVTTPNALEDRIEVIRRRDAFDRDPAAFLETWKGRNAAVKRRITIGRKRIADVDVPLDALERAAELCMALGTDGLRGELTLIRAARASAALAGRDAVTPDDVRDVAALSLRHRLRRDPLDETSATARVERAVEQVCTP